MEARRHPRDKVLLVRDGRKRIIRQQQGAAGAPGAQGEPGADGLHLVEVHQGQWTSTLPVSEGQTTTVDGPAGGFYMCTCADCTGLDPTTHPECWYKLLDNPAPPEIVTKEGGTGEFQGAWSATRATDYAEGDTVEHNGSLWWCEVAHTPSADKEPNEDSTYWTLMVRAGKDGTAPSEISLQFDANGTAAYVAGRARKIIGRTSPKKADGTTAAGVGVALYVNNVSVSASPTRSDPINLAAGDVLKVKLTGVTSLVALTLVFA